VFQYNVTGIPLGQYRYVAVRGRDRAGRLSPMSPDITVPPQAVGTGEPALPGDPGKVALVAYPNPFERSVTVRLDNAGAWAAATGAFSEGTGPAGAPRLDIFDVQGRRIRWMGPGRTSGNLIEWDWDGRDGLGRAVPSGIYWARASGRSGEARVRLLRVSE
jgi:hypothetical protein